MKKYTKLFQVSSIILDRKIAVSQMQKAKLYWGKLEEKNIKYILFIILLEMG